jgi:hypothetical protein
MSFSQSEKKVVEEIDETPKVISNFAAEFTEDGQGFDIEYFLSADLDPEIIINDDENSLTFKIIGEIELEDEWLIVMIPPEVIEFPMLVYVDGEKEPKSILSTINGTSTMYVPLSQDSKEVKIIGIKVIPEFGSFVPLILMVSIFGVIIFTSKIQKLNLRIS